MLLGPVLPRILELGDLPLSGAGDKRIDSKEGDMKPIEGGPDFLELDGTTSRKQ